MESLPDSLNHLILNLEHVPKVMACGIHGLIVDIFGDDLQEITLSQDIRPAYIVVNLLALDGKGYMIFSWLPEDAEIVMKFVESIKKCTIDSLGDRLTNYIFMFFENVFVSEVWWEELGENQSNINKLMMQGVIMHTYDCSLIEKNSIQYNAIQVKDIIELY